MERTTDLERVENPYEGDRYKVVNADDYYHILCTVPGSMANTGAYAILDEEDGGYIAFFTSETVAADVCEQLMAVHRFDQWREQSVNRLLAGGR